MRQCYCCKNNALRILKLPKDYQDPLQMIYEMTPLVFKKFAVKFERRLAIARLRDRQRCWWSVDIGTRPIRQASRRRSVSTRSTSTAQRWWRLESGRRLNVGGRRRTTTRRPKHSGHHWHSRTPRDDSADANRRRCFDSSTEPCTPEHAQ